MPEPMHRAFFRDIPETTLLVDVEQTVRDGKAREELGTREL